MSDRSDARLLNLMAPPDHEFFGKDFMPAEALDSLARDLSARHEELNFIRDYDLQVLWKRSGGSKGGRGVLGKCSSPSGLTRFYSAKDWVIWLGADHVRAHGFNAQQTEALLYHEMLHCAVEEPPDRPPKVTTIAHDVEVFNKEIERYGLWTLGLKEISATIGKQLSLGLDGDGKDPD